MADVRKGGADSESWRRTLVSQLQEHRDRINTRALRRVRHASPRSEAGVDDGGSTPADGPFPSGTAVQPEVRTLAVAIGVFIIATIVCDRTAGARGEKMARAGRRLFEGLSELLAESGLDPEVFDDVFLSLTEDWSEADRVGLLIDLDFSDPFFPYELAVDPKDFEFALRAIAEALGFRRDVVGEIKDIRRSAQRAHRAVNWAKIGVFGAGGLVLVGAGAFVLAPLAGAALGAAAGYSGAAATSWGLALLGGGSLASGGAGMAGGLWLVTGTGAALGLLAGTGSAALYEMGAAQARVEMTRLQVTYKMTLLSGQVDMLKAQQVVSTLAAQLDDLRASLAEERLLNDENSNRVKDLQQKVVAIEEALSWMDEQQKAAT